MHVSSQADSQEMVKTDKMVHVSMRDENISDSEDLPGLKPVYLSDVEKNSFICVFEFYINPRIG